MAPRKRHRDGVSAALDILSALALAEGPVAAAQLALQLGVPRTSLYRILRVLAAAGLVVREAGEVRVGPTAGSILATHVAAVERDDARRRARLPRAYAARMPSAPGAGTAWRHAVRLPLRPRGRSLRFRIGFSNASLDNPWRTALIHSIEAAASNLSDHLSELSVRHAHDSVAQQAADIADFVAEGVDGLIVSAVDPEGSRPAIAAAMARGIPTVLVDRGLKAMGYDTCLVSADDRLIGDITAAWLAEATGGRGRVLMLSGREDAEPARIRLAAARACFAAFPGLTLEHHWADWRRDKGMAITADAIRRHGDGIAGVWADSGLQGVGAIEAFLAAGFADGAIPPHTGGDLNVAYKLALRHHIRLAAIDYPPAMGLYAVETLFAAMSGQWVPARVAVRSPVIITRGAATRSVRPDRWAEEHVRWDQPDDLILATGLGQNYSPRSFRVHYPGNRYNRSAARTAA